MTRTDPGHPDLRAAAPVTMRRLVGSPLRFLRHYVRSHPIGHAIVLISVVAAVICSVSTQYGMKRLIDAIATGNTTSHAPAAMAAVWAAFAVLCGLIAADNLLWRIGGWAAAHTFVAVTGDIRRDMFAYLTSQDRKSVV